MSEQRFVNSGSPKSDHGERFREAFRRNAHSLIPKGYARLNTNLYRAAHEEDITGTLVREIRAHLDDPRTPSWCNAYNAREEERQNVSDRLGKSRPRVDITFECSERGPRPHFRFDAKRLGANHGARKYLGPEGLGCLLTGTYARDDGEAGMLGYVQSESASIWTARIRSDLDDTPADYRLCPGERWASVRLDPQLGESYRTRHFRNNRIGRIDVYHTFLEFL